MTIMRKKNTKKKRINLPGILAAAAIGIIEFLDVFMLYRKIRNAYLVSYNRAIPTLRQADHCISCGECLMHCPQSIPIPQELMRINRYIERLKQDKL